MMEIKLNQKENEIVEKIIIDNRNAIKYFEFKKNGILKNDRVICNNFILLLRYYFNLFSISVLYSQYSIDEKSIIYRARNITINQNSRKFNSKKLDEVYNSIENINFHGFNGFDKKNSDAPSSKICFNGGRCNYPFKSLLYAAETEKVAVDEIVTHNNQYISIAKIISKKNLVLANFSTENFKVSDNYQIKWFNDFATEIAKIFNFVVEDYNRNDIYTITRYFTSVIKMLGFDGLRFTSSKTSYDDKIGSKGHNIVLFNKNAYEVVASKIVKILDIKIDYEPKNYVK